MQSCPLGQYLGSGVDRQVGSTKASRNSNLALAPKRELGHCALYPAMTASPKVGYLSSSESYLTSLLKHFFPQDVKEPGGSSPLMIGSRCGQVAEPQ